MPAAKNLWGVLGLRCLRCSSEQELAEPGYVCGCGGNLQVIYDYPELKKRVTRKRLQRSSDRSIWRYADLLPTPAICHRPRPRIIRTPLYKAERLGRALGLKNVFIKDDGRNPSASFKDRASAVAVARALDMGRRVVAGASTGNAASSLACMAAGTNLKTIVFVPETAPAAKLAQLLIFGAVVVAVKGTYDDAFDLCLKAAAEFGWYNRNTGYNAFTREGKKTCSFEIVEQLHWNVPDLVFVPVGDGNIISGIWKGFRDFFALGLIDSLPRLVAVQAAKSDAIARAFDGDGALRPVSGKTIADSISVSLPRDGEAAVQALRESEGFAVKVTDREILQAMKDMARMEGVFAEPAGAAAAAGLRKAAARKLVKPNEKIVVLATGNGLKDTDSARRAAGKPHLIRPDIADLKRLVKRLNRGDKL
ncbi:MAG: threonine synthase [Elusimicrobiota bacterium]